MALQYGYNNYEPVYGVEPNSELHAVVYVLPVRFPLYATDVEVYSTLGEMSRCHQPP